MTSSVLHDTLEGLPVRVVDVYETWSSLFIASTIPLGRLEWIWNSRGTSIRESSLSAKAVFERSETPTVPKTASNEKAQEWYQKPYFHVFVVPISELETTKSTSGWPTVRKFVNFCRERSDEYIVAVVATDHVARQNRKLLERLRAEVNVSVRGRERVVTVPAATVTEDQKPITHLYNSPSHQDLLIKLRECSRSGVEARVQRYENELARLLAKRASGSFSFCSFFSVKEAMGFVFCQLGRRDIALKLLDELYSSMIEIDGHEGTRAFCTETPCEAASSVTNVNGKEYQKLFAEESITEMEMRTYLFARQTEIMLPDRKFADIAERGLKLITAISRRCIEEYASQNTPASSCFRDAWVFTASRALASTLAPAIPSSAPNSNMLSPQLSTPKERHTARLIAGFHVHALKAFLGLAKMVLPGTMAPQKENEVSFPEDSRKKLLHTFNEELRDALSTPNNAEILFSEIANAAASLYEMGGRRRGAAALDGDAGVIRLRNGSLSEAEKLLNEQCTRFSDDHSWDDLHQRKRQELARAEKELGKVQEYLVSCLTMLFMTREVRKTSLSSARALKNREKEQEHASFWAKEAYETAGKLPRVMKYDAEKLVSVSVRPSDISWCEGDRAEATVIIDSDMPADFKIDYVFIELKGSSGNTLETKAPSALRAVKPESPSGSRSAALIMKSKDAIVSLRPGTNETKVYCDEVPGSGRYSVSLVGLFIGKLKLVALAPKLETGPTVLMKASPSQKESTHKTASHTPPSNLGQAAVKFPWFYAEPREVPVLLSIHQDVPVFLVQGLVQTAHVDVKPKTHGIAKGSSLHVHLSFGDSKEAIPALVLGKVVEISRCIPEDNDTKPELISFTVISQQKCELAISIDEEIMPGAPVAVRVSIEVPKDSPLTIEEKKSIETKCILKVDFVGQERSSTSKRDFVCSGEHVVEVLNPVSISSRSDLHTRPSEMVSAAQIGDNIVLPGGTLVCSLQSHVAGNRALTLHGASLELPEWLQLSEVEDPPHVDLLPCSVNLGGRFIFAFDIDVCSSKLHLGMRQDSLSHVSESLSQRRYARISKDVQTSGGEDENESEKKVNVDSKTSMELEPKNEDADVEMNDTSEPMQIADLEPGNATDSWQKPANEVVDLSSGISGNIANLNIGSEVSVLSPEQSSATLRVDFSIDGIEGSTQVENAISMISFRPQPRMYRVERNCAEHVSAGEAVELTFCISVGGSPLLPQQERGEHEILQYEIQADPNHWVVAGRKRGRMRISLEISDVGRATLIPLVTGRILVPTIGLYAEAGNAIAENCVETFNESMQVIVLPCTNVTAVCDQRKSNIHDGVFVGGSLHGPGRLKAHMPAVVTFDSFFES